MADFNLASNEGIIIQYEGACHNEKECEIALTNQNLICVEHIEKLFKATTYNTIKIPLNSIKVINGKAQASVINSDGEWVLQVLLKNGVEKFEFLGESNSKKNKKIADEWAEQISLVLTGKPIENTTDTSLVGGLIGGVVGGAKNILSTVGINIRPKTPTNITIRCIGCLAPMSGQQGQKVCCKYCDTEQTL